ncbi:MAG TPA: T9SS type A sorting domain-containing protein [Candidatus Kapabacteria bacterium]|nr:T9SS type A sorting domain-containing protein [Candidatus Kapabacteria bacterium]
MKNKLPILLLFIFLCSIQSNAKTYNISPDSSFKKPSDVVNIVEDGDTIAIQSGEYFEDVASWRKNNLTFIGINGYAHLNANGKSAERKAIWVIKGNNCRVENIEFSNCHVPDNNGAGIRLEGANLTISHCYFHDNQEGILTGSNPNSVLIVEYSEFSNNSADDGLSHNLYIGHLKEFHLQYCYVHNARVGHNVKSRSGESYILYNRIMDEDTGTSSYLIDLPNGGLACVMGNILMKGTASENPSAISYGYEGTSDTIINSLFLINNTFLNYKNNGKFAQIKDGITNFESLVINNLIAGTSNFITGKSDTVTNLIFKNIDDAMLVDPEQYDYHLLESSPARNAGKNPLDFSQNIYGFYPKYEYMHKASIITRTIAKVIDIGAYEFPESETAIEKESQQSFKLFPNPNNGTFSLSTNTSFDKNAKITIFNTLGQILLEMNPVLFHNNRLEFDLSNFLNGIYFLKLESNNKIIFEKFIIK